jgi:hypothetical protein
MELSIDYTCPRCGEITEQKLCELSPGRQRLCTPCQIPTELTPASLRRLATQLETDCRA